MNRNLLLSIIYIMCLLLCLCNDTYAQGSLVIEIEYDYYRTETGVEEEVIVTATQGTVDTWTPSGSGLNITVKSQNGTQLTLGVTANTVDNHTLQVDAHSSQYGDDDDTCIVRAADINVSCPVYVPYEEGCDIDYSIDPPCSVPLGIVYVRDTSDNYLFTHGFAQSSPYSGTYSWDGKGDCSPYNGQYLPAGTYIAGYYSCYFRDEQEFYIIDVEMKLEEIGIVIDPTNNYSENATIRVTAVNASNGQTCTWFTGNVSIAEDASDPDYGEIYTKNGGYLPSSITFSTSDQGVKTFIAKSLAGSKCAVSLWATPDSAKIMTTNYEVYNAEGYLSVEQWIDREDFGGKGTGNDITDWFEKRIEDIFASTNQDVAGVVSKVNSYEEFYDPYVSYIGIVYWSNPYVIYISPNDDYMRENGAPSGSYYGYYADHYNTNLVLHESRHCYQNYLISVDLGQDEDDPDPESCDDPDNDDDQDRLVDYVPIAPTGWILDTDTERTTYYGTKSFNGDDSYDYYTDNVQHVVETDACDFACQHD